MQSTIFQWLIKCKCHIDIFLDLCAMQVHLSRSWVKTWERKKTWKSRLEADIMWCMLHTVTCGTIHRIIWHAIKLPSTPSIKKKKCYDLLTSFLRGKVRSRESTGHAHWEKKQNSENWIKALPPKYVFFFFNSIEINILRKTSLLSDAVTCCCLLPSETYSQHTNYRRSIAASNKNIFFNNFSLSLTTSFSRQFTTGS